MQDEINLEDMIMQLKIMLDNQAGNFIEVNIPLYGDKYTLTLTLQKKD